MPILSESQPYLIAAHAALIQAERLTVDALIRRTARHPGRLTVKHLRGVGACRFGVRQFLDTCGPSIYLTPTLCAALAPMAQRNVHTARDLLETVGHPDAAATAMHIGEATWRLDRAKQALWAWESLERAKVAAAHPPVSGEYPPPANHLTATQRAAWLRHAADTLERRVAAQQDAVNAGCAAVERAGEDTRDAVAKAYERAGRAAINALAAFLP